MTSRTVLHILGPAWSGSSLLNALLNTQPTIAGLGEAWHFRDPDRGVALCSRCCQPVTRATCQLAAAIDVDRLYGSVFDVWPHKSVLVDASKAIHLGLALENDREDRSVLEQKAIVLTKHPSQWVPSAMRHENYSVSSAFDMWTFIVTDTIRQLTERFQLSWLPVSYDDLTQQPDRVVEEIGRFLNVPFAPERIAQWYRTDTCIAGGNMAVYMQFADQGRLESGEFGEWYRNKSLQIRRDERWREDESILAECLEEWRKREARLTELMAQLGHRTGWPTDHRPFADGSGPQNVA